jgi:hypothetical protein
MCEMCVNRAYVPARSPIHTYVQMSNFLQSDIVMATTRPRSNGLERPSIRTEFFLRVWQILPNFCWSITHKNSFQRADNILDGW